MAKGTKQKEDNQEISAFEKTLKQLEEKYGKGTVINGKSISGDLEVVSSGSITLDIETGCNGIPIGRLLEYMGMESSGKSTAALHNIAEFQKLPGKVVLCDFEQSFDKNYAEEIGVNVDDLIILQANCMEDGYNIIEVLIKTNEVRLVVIDSHTSAMPRKVVDGEVGDVTVGLQARINSQALGKIKPLLRSNRCTVIGISQIRQDIGSMGEVNKSTGGLAWKFYSDMRFKFAKIMTEKDRESNKTEVNITKNKCGVPWGKAVFHINWGTGIDRLQEIIDFAVQFDIIKKGGSWYTIGESKVQGDEALKQLLIDNPEFAIDIETKVMEKIKELK